MSANASPVLEANGLAFAYPNGVNLFSAFSLDVYPGSMASITGRSGSGKSTLLYCLAGVLQCSGTIRLDGQPLAKKDSVRAAARLKNLGFIFQRGELLPELTVLENVMLPLQMLRAVKSEAREKAHELLARLDITDCSQRRPNEISGGQAQRASVARALVHDPRLILADEPTASLDEYSKEKVVTALLQASAAGTAVVCASHDSALNAAADFQVDLSKFKLETAATHA